MDITGLTKRRTSLTEQEKYYFYSHRFIPDVSYQFPLKDGRGFLHRYLTRYSWLSYSQKENGGYCMPCVLFAKSIDIRKGRGVFIETAFTNFKKMYEMCDFHAAREYHKDAIAVCDAFVVTMSGKQESVLVQLREGARETIQINRKKLRSIIETIALCGCQNISLHGHQDSLSDIKVNKQQVTTMAIFGLFLTFVFLQVTQH